VTGKSNFASRAQSAGGDLVAVVVANRHRRVEAAVSVRRARLEVPAVTAGADERGVTEVRRRCMKTL